MMPILLSLALAAAPVTPAGGTVSVKGKRFMAEVASTPGEQRTGLMRRQSLAADRCMFFLYQEDGFHSIWMRNCLISLDVAWLSSDGTVVELAERCPPCPPHLRDDCPSYGGTVEARHFVEFPAGTFHRIGLHKGDRLGWALTLEDGSSHKGGVAVPAEAPAKGKGRTRARKR